MFDHYDEFYMRRALELARKGEGRVEPNPMVGALLVRPEFPSEQGTDPLNRIVGEGYHPFFGGDHAEVVALKMAKQQSKGAVCYVTLEPCCHFGKTPPCCDALIKAGVKKVVIAMADPFPKVAGGGIQKLREAGIEVVVGLLEEKSRALNAPYLTRIQKHRPWIIGKWAMTLDGKMATRTGSSYWISSEESRRRVHRLRSRMDAIMVGSRTASEDNPRLTVRLPEGEISPRTPIRIVFDSEGTLSKTSSLALTAHEVPLLLAFGSNVPEKERQFWKSKGAEVFISDASTHKERLVLFLEELAKRGVTNLLVEGGGTLLGHLFDMEMLDEVHVFITPKLVGGANAVVPLAGLGLETMDNAASVTHYTMETIGSDILISGRLLYRK